MCAKIDPAVAGEISKLKKTIDANDKKIKKLHDEVKKSTEQKTKQLKQQVDELKTLGTSVNKLLGEHNSIMSRQGQQIAELGGT